MADKEKKKDKDKEKEKDKEKDKGKDKEKEKDKEKKKDKEKDKDKTEVDMTTRTGAKDKSKIVVHDLPDSVMGDDLLQSPIIKNERRCVHHLQPLTLYCESCEEPICDRCRVTGPHNNQMHRINLIEEAYKVRVIGMHQVITGNLLAKRDQLLAQVHRIDHRLEEIKHVKGFVERDVRSEFGGILERLRSAEGVKLAVLQHEIATLQRDIDKINDVVNVVNELTSEKEHIDFLLRCRHLTDTIEFAVAKPFKTTIEVVPYDLPRELAQQREKIEKMNIVQDILEMKDQLIYEMVNRLGHEEEKVSSDMNKAAQEEINEWSKLTDRFAGELRKYQIICHYCGIAMDTKNINQVCQANDTPEHSGSGFTVDKPEKGWHGTRRHFFSKPKSQLVKAGRVATLEAHNAHYLRRNEVEQSVHRGQYHMFLEVLLAKVRKHCADKDIQIDKLFAEYDKTDTGVLNHIAFTFLLNEFCGIDLIEIDKLKDILDPQSRNQIHYAEFVKMINDPQYLAAF